MVCVIVLLSQRPDKLLATIRSRCQLIQFPTPDQKTSLDWLSSKLSDSDQGQKLLALASGSPLTALEYHESDVLDQRDQMFTAFKALRQGQHNPLSVANDWLKMDLDMTLYCMMS